MTLLWMDIQIQKILMFVAVLGLFWTFFLFTHRRGNIMANRYLGILVGILAVFVLRRIANLEDSDVYLFLYFASQGFIFFIGPSIYFHIQTLTQVQPKTSQIVKHFLPGILVILFMIGLFYFRATIQETESLKALKIGSIIFISIQVVHLLGYLLYSRKLVLNYEKLMESVTSTSSRINLKWLKVLMRIATILGVGVFGIHVLIVTGGYYQINNSADGLFLILIAIIILSIIYQSWSEPEFVSGIYKEKSRYQNSPLSDQVATDLLSKLKEVIDNQEVFRTRELNINQLADQLGTQSYLLSQLLNERYGLNFFNFINQHRIRYAKQQLLSGYLDNRTLEAMAYDAGFNSKSTFNRTFKKEVGCTPKEFVANSKVHQ